MHLTKQHLKKIIKEEYSKLLKENDSLSFSETISLEQLKDYIDTFNIGPNSTPESLATFLDQRMSTQPHMRDTIIMHLKAAIRGVKGYERESDIAKQAAIILGLEEGLR
jgi:hypothetical protein